MLTKYCRLCMNEECLQPVDSFLSNAIRNEFTVEIRANDELSQEICEQCSIFILKLLDFKKNVDIVQKLLQKTLKRNNNDCQVTGDHVPNNVVDVSVGDVNNETRVNLIDQKGKDGNEMDNQENINFIRKIIRSIDFNEITSPNTRSEIRWTPNGTYCEVCGVSLKQQFAFEKHMKSTSHAFKSYIAEKYGKLDVVRQYSCGYTCPCCQQVKTSKKELARHSKEAHGFTAQRTNLKPDTLIFKGGSPCSDARSQKIRPALVEVVDDNIKTEPLDVSAASSGGEKVAGELVVQGDPRKYPCKFCSRSFCFVESFHKHLKKHHPEKHLCLQCGYVSRNRRLYAQHVRSHYNLTANQKVCSICFKICNDRVELHAHRKRVHDPIKKAFVCSLCKEMFVSVIELKQHKREIHFATPKNAAKSNFKCKKCNRTFVSELVLKIHQCTAKKFVCLKKCGKRFELYSKMERHMKRCTKGYTIYTCMHCKKKLSCLKTLKYHLTKCPLNSQNKIMEKADIRCTLCELEFETEMEFEKHYDECHKSIAGSSRCEEATSPNVIDLVTERNKTSTSKNYWRCKKCRLKCLSLTELEQHFASCSGIKTKHVKCHCGAVFVDQKVLRLHNIVDHQVDKSVLITKKVSMESSSKIKKKSALSASRIDATTNGKDSLVGERSKASKQSKHQSPRSSQEVGDCNERTPAPATAPPLSHNNDTVRKKSSSSGNSVAGDDQEKNESVAVPNNQTDSKDATNKSSIRKPKRSFNTCTENTSPNADTKMPLPTVHDKNEELIFQNISSNANKSASAGNRQNERNKNSSVFEPASSLACSVADITAANKFSRVMNENEPNLESAKTMNNSIIQTVACSHCGLVFNSKYFLHKHEYDAHKMLRDRLTADTNIESKRSHLISNNHLKQEYETVDRKSPKFFERQNYRDSRYHSFAKTSSRSSRSLSESERFDDRYRWPTNRSSNRNENGDELLRNSSKITTPAKSLLRPDYLLNTGQITFTNSPSNSLSKGKNQLTITSNVNNAVCDVCKNPEPHLFCAVCRTCYRGNQVQYMNHMKMKHSS